MEEKDFSEFGKHKTKPDGLQYSCRSCVKISNRKWQVENRSKRREINQNVRIKFADYVNQYKSDRGCELCGWNIHSCGLDFHHKIPKEKEFSIASFASFGVSSRLKKEISKCMVVCANCHRLIHNTP
jgi:hypothetical protein